VLTALCACTAGESGGSADTAPDSALRSGAASSASARRAILLDPDHPAWSEPAPDTFLARFTTTEGDFTVEVVRAWAPIGADRFHGLVRHGYYDDARFHRVVPGFITQWGLAGDPEVTAAWIDRTLPDDTSVVASNVRGAIAFAFTEVDTRATQVYINMADNSRLDAQGFPPFGRVVDGMHVVGRLYGGYGEESGGGMRAGAQDSVIAGGNAYLDRAFPELDRILHAEVIRR
jgi:homoserine O-acetyltransferase